jgi:signal transduction histidine kinase
VTLPKAEEGAGMPEERSASAEGQPVPKRSDEAMIHEVKNLLLVIGRVSDVLLSQTDLGSSTRRDVEQIRVATKRADELTHRLFEFASRPAQAIAVDVNTLLCRIEPVLDRLVGKDIGLSLNLERALSPIRVDPIQLEQALLNLVLNARDAIADQGEIAISTRRVVFPEAPGTTLPPGRYVALSVHDNGKGIDDETRAGLFDAPRATQARSAGKGLGLAVVRAFVTESGGEVRVTSRPEIGTTVELRFPELNAAPRAAGDHG